MRMGKMGKSWPLPSFMKATVPGSPDSKPRPVPLAEISQSRPRRGRGGLGLSGFLAVFILLKSPAGFPPRSGLHTAARQECGPARGPQACLCS